MLSSISHSLTHSISLSLRQRCIQLLPRYSPSLYPTAPSRRMFSESSDIVTEVNRVMANPEDAQGNPVALDFSKGSKTKGYSKPYSKNYDNIFGDKKDKNKKKGKIEKEL
jgi:hypothetical protein